MAIKRYSCSYANSKDNFTIIYDAKGSADKKFKNSKLFGLYCVVQNILQRSDPSVDNKPTKLSKYLEMTLTETDNNEPVRFISNCACNWNKTIKGDTERSDYPALYFYNVLLPFCLGEEYAFVRNLVLPEADFDLVVGEKTLFSGQSVDFYIPVINLVIEIDGASHLDFDQRRKDESRDKELARHGIKIVRIATYDIKQKTPKLQTQLSALCKTIKDNDIIKEYKSKLSEPVDNAVLERETVMRLQQMLLLGLMEQVLDINKETWTFTVRNSDVSDIENLLSIGFEDLKRWIQAVSELLRIPLKYPTIVFDTNESNADIIVDFSCFQRYDNLSVASDKLFIVRTDYYSDRNLFQLAVADTLRYDVDPFNNEQDLRVLEFLLDNIFGHSDFNEGQLPIITNVLKGEDTVGILPTGSGKSLCYQLAALLQPGVTLIVDPIISLMQDQKRAMHDINITQNEMISSMAAGDKRGKILSSFENGKYQMLWISPERFQSEDFRGCLLRINSNLNFSLAVIDEVHCLSEWGHDFRVSYLTLVRTLREYCPAAILLGLTATASQFVLQDIRAEFGGNKILDAVNVKASPNMDREELEYKRINVRTNYERNEVIKKIVATEEKNGNAGALFCPTVGGKFTGCEAMKTMLLQGIPGDGQTINKNHIGMFHGKMGQKERMESQKDFLNNEFSLMICTKAFGMGVDKQNLRYTIHNSLPASVESFYQEAGRAGRDHNAARCYIINQVSDEARIKVNKYKTPKEMLKLIERESESSIRSSDLETTLYFMRESHDEEIKECNYIYGIYKRLINTETISFVQEKKKKHWDFGYDYYEGENKQKLENALYKLSLLGIVTGWTVKYKNIQSGTCHVQVIDQKQFSDEEVLANFLKYVCKYDPEFSLEDNSDYLNIWQKDDIKLRGVIQMLIRWTNENIVYQRMQRTITMMNWCSKEVDDRAFRRYLEGYFRFNEETAYLEYIAYHPKNWREWFRLFFYFEHEDSKGFSLIDKDKARINYASLQRFLESYQNNTGLNYLDGLLQLYYKENVTINDLGRLINSLEIVKRMSEPDKKEILKYTLVVGSRIENIETRDLLSRLLNEFFPYNTKLIYSRLKDRYSLSIELQKAANRMENLKWII